jgi:hypothetical protein
MGEEERDLMPDVDPGEPAGDPAEDELDVEELDEDPAYDFENPESDYKGG